MRINASRKGTLETCRVFLRNVLRTLLEFMKSLSKPIHVQSETKAKEKWTKKVIADFVIESAFLNFVVCCSLFIFLLSFSFYFQFWQCSVHPTTVTVEKRKEIFSNYFDCFSVREQTK